MSAEPPDQSSREYKMERRKKTLRCSYCPPHRKENATVSKRGARKPKRKK